MNVTLAPARLSAPACDHIRPELDVRQAQTSYDQARSDIAETTTRVAQDQNALNLLARHHRGRGRRSRRPDKRGIDPGRRAACELLTMDDQVPATFSKAARQALKAVGRESPSLRTVAGLNAIVTEQVAAEANLVAYIYR